MGAVRFAECDEVHRIASLYHDVWHETHGPKMPQAESKARDAAFFVGRIGKLMPNVLLAKDDDQIVGFASWSGCLLGQIFVAPAYRGRHVATELLLRTETEMCRQGVDLAELHCLVGNERARRFYERAGWTLQEIISESMNGEADDNSRDFWSMCKRLA